MSFRRRRSRGQLIVLLSLAAVMHLLAATGRVTPPADSMMGPGVSRALAVSRASRIRDVRYELMLNLTERDSARGKVTARFKVTKPGDVILDFRGQRLGSVEVNGKQIESPDFNGAHLRILAPSVVVGENVVTIVFVTKIAAAGASIIRYRDATDGSEYLYTLLVPADANQLFPCFDQPDLKARVHFIAVAPREWKVLANAPSVPELLSTGTPETAHSFEWTEPISTYLIAFAAGPWATVTATASKRPITMYVRKSRIAEAEADSIILANDVAARWLEGYFARPFPFKKLDILLAPAFPFGGMEHPGAIFYSEDRFIFRERPTLTQRLGRTATIYHEVAHQWFGDLVTMRWFDDLWLKEGFATYMAAKMQASLDTSSGVWKTFYLRNKPTAYSVDATRGTTPVWQSLDNLDQAKSNYGAIVYNKAPSVLKQLDYLVGPDAFQRGVRRFLNTHAYANATWRDLLGAISAESGRPLESWGKQYILRPGMPVVDQELQRAADGTTRLVLRQQPAQTVSGNGAWPVRTSVIVGTDDGKIVRLPVSLDNERTVITLPKTSAELTFVFANADDYAYALVLPDAQTVAWLEQNISTVRDSFLRAMLWGALWDLVREARLDPARYAALALRELPKEPDEQIVSGVLGRVGRAIVAYLPAARRDSAVASVEAALRAGAADASRPYGFRKPYLDTYIRVATTPAALSNLDALLDSSEAAGAPLRAPTRWAIVTALIERRAPTGERRVENETRADSGSEGKRRAFVAGAARPDGDVKREYFTRYFSDEALNEDWVTASLDGFNSVRQTELTRPYLIPALDSLRWIQTNRRIFFLGSWLTSFLEGQTSAESLISVDRFLSEHPQLPRDLREKILQAEDELTRTVRIRGATR
ncbi:MAG TPA: M1 family aminopeptidase [Gemmatimonadaceae bacterium]|nr:M1 family aminopeptidase [Gemmatimonadaceae bacterium]